MGAAAASASKEPPWLRREAAPPLVLTQGPGLEPSVFIPGGRVLGWAGGARGLGAGLCLYLKGGGSLGVLV